MAFLLRGDVSSLQILTRLFPPVDELTHLSPAGILCALNALKRTRKFSRWFYSERTDWSRSHWEQKTNITRRITREEVFKQMLRLPNDGLTSIQAFQQGNRGKETALGWLVSLVLLAARIFKWSIYLKSWSLWQMSLVPIYDFDICLLFQITVFTRKPPGKPTLRYAVVSRSATPRPALCNPKDSPWGFSRQEYWSGLPCPPPGSLPNPGIEPRPPALQADSLLTEPPGEPK